MPRVDGVVNGAEGLTVDLNADLGEADTPTRQDLDILDVVTSASLACGFHAGNRAVMRATAEAAVDRGVTIGAHVSYRDRQGFGRRPLAVPAPQLLADLDEQYATLAEEVGTAGGSVAYVKPHGALYNQMGVDPEVAEVVVESVMRSGSRMLVAQAGTDIVDLARRAGLLVFTEAFPDRAYLGDGRLAPRTLPGAVVTDPDTVSRRAVGMVTRGGVEAVDGSWLELGAASLCIHGDGPGAATAAHRVAAALEAAGVTLLPFALPDGPVALPDGPVALPDSPFAPPDGPVT